MSLRPSLMTGTDLDSAVSACAFLLGCDQRYGEIDATTRKFLEQLLDEGAKEQLNRRQLSQSVSPVSPSRPELPTRTKASAGESA